MGKREKRSFDKQTDSECSKEAMMVLIRMDCVFCEVGMHGHIALRQERQLVPFHIVTTLAPHVHKESHPHPCVADRARRKAWSMAEQSVRNQRRGLSLRM
jgi:hypothetical protein